MTITLDTADAKRVAALVARATNFAHPILGAVHIACADGVATWTATDGDLAITTELDCTGADGRVLLGAKRLADVLGRCPGSTVTLTPDEGTLVVASGRWRAKLPTIPAAEYDPYLPGDGNCEATFDGDAFLAAVGRVVLACSIDKSREMLAGLCLEPEDGGVRLTATDSYRLSTVHLPSDGIDAPAIVPATALHVLTAAHQAGDKVELCTTDRRAWFTTGRTTIATTLIAGTYVQWRQILPHAEPVGHLTVADPDELATAVLRSGRLFGGDMGLVTLTLSAEAIAIEAMAADEGEGTEELAATWTGPEGFAITFRAGFLAEGLRSIPGAVTAALIDDLKPVVFRATDAADTDDLYLLMPVRRH